MNLFLKLVASLSLVLVSLHVHAKVILEIPEFVDLKVVNMAKPKLIGGLLDTTKTVELPNGVNQILFQYNPVFINKDKVERVYGELIVVKFTAADETLSFALPNYKNAFEAKRLIGSLQWQLKYADGSEVAKQQDQLHIEGVRLGRDFTQDIEQYNKDQGVAAVGLSYVTVNNMDGQAVVTSVESVDHPTDLLDELKKLYQTASERERKEFQKWIIDQQ